MKRWGFLTLALGLFLGCLKADSMVTFNGGPSLSWAGGTFSTDLSGDYPDGFWALTSTSAYNGYGQNGEYIVFNSPVTLNFLDLEGGQSEGCCGQNVASVIVSLYDTLGDTLASQTDTSVTSLQTLTFDTVGVSKIVFDITGGTNYYGDGRSAAWYVVSDIDYNGTLSAVPEPTSTLLLATVLVGLGCFMRRKIAS